MRTLAIFFLLLTIAPAAFSQAKRRTPKRDIQLTIVEITGFDKSKTIGYLQNFTDSTVLLLRPDSSSSSTVQDAIHYQDIFDIRYFKYGSFGNGFINALAPSNLFFCALALPVIDYWGVLILISSPIVTIPFSTLVGIIDVSRKSKSNYRINGELKKFQIQANREIHKAYKTSSEISFTETGNDWYPSLDQNNKYYPKLNYRPKLHLSFSAVPIIQGLKPKNSSAFFERFKESKQQNEYISSSRMSISLSLSERWEVGGLTFIGQSRSKSWTLSEGDFFYSYRFTVDHQYNALFGMFHVLPYIPNKQPFQLSVGGGLAFNEGQYQSRYEGSYLNAEFSSWRDRLQRLPSISPYIQARSEAFFAEGFSMHISCELVPVDTRGLEPLQLTAPFIEDPISQQFNISSLTFSAGIRIHY